MKADSVFIRKVITSRNSFMIWIPKDEAEFLSLKENDFVSIGIKKEKPK